MKEIIEYSSQGRISLKNNYARPTVSFRKTNMGQNSFSYIGHSVWNKLPSSIKKIYISLNIL